MADNYIADEQVRHNTAVCLTTYPWPLPRQMLRRTRLSSYSVNFRYLQFSLGLSSSCCSLLSCLLVCSIFPSITCFRKQFPRYMYPIQSIVLRSYLSRILLSCLPLCNTSLLTRSVQLTEELGDTLHLLQDGSLSPAVLHIVSVSGSSRNDINYSLLIRLN